NAGATAVGGGWLDSVYISTTPSVTSGSVLLGIATHGGGLAAEGSYDGTMSAAVPPVGPGNYYIVVQTDSLDQVLVTNRADLTLAANRGQEVGVSLTPLTIGAPTQGEFTPTDQSQYYQVTVPASEAMQVTLASKAASGALALYLSPFTEPTPYSY